MAQSNVPPFPSGLGGQSDQMFRELYARVHGAEARVLTVPGEDDEGPELVGIPVLASVPARTVWRDVRVEDGYWNDEDNAVLMLTLEPPAIILGAQVMIRELLSPIVKDKEDVVLTAHMRVGVGRGEGSSNLAANDQTYFADTDTLFGDVDGFRFQNVIGASWKLDLTSRLHQGEPVDRVGALLGVDGVDVARDVRHVYAGFFGSRPDGAFPDVEFPPDQKGIVSVSVTYVDSSRGSFVEGLPLLLAAEPV